MFAGISADGRVLASKIRVECQSYRYSMGIPPSVEHIAKYVGERFLGTSEMMLAASCWFLLAMCIQCLNAFCSRLLNS